MTDVTLLHPHHVGRAGARQAAMRVGLAGVSRRFV